MKGQVEVHSSARGRVLDAVAVAKRMRILLNGRQVARITLSPSLEEEAAVGYLAGQGIVRYVDIRKVVLGPDFADVSAGEAGSFEVSEAGDCGNWAEAVVKGDVSTKGAFVDASVLKKAMELLQSNSSVWQETGGTHSCGFFSFSGELRFMAEDVSRHVALDKVIGIGLRSGADLSAGIVGATGRVSSSCVLKCARMGVPVLVSRSAPLFDAVEAANASGLTLVGFARGNRFNAYSNFRLFEGKV